MTVHVFLYWTAIAPMWVRFGEFIQIVDCIISHNKTPSSNREVGFQRLVVFEKRTATMTLTQV